MKKASQKKEANSTSSTQTEGADYWANRPLDDARFDWRNGGTTWIEEYIRSAEHPHRALILDAVRTFSPCAGILEIGCNAGPNLIQLARTFPETQLAGIDINPQAVEVAQAVLPKAILSVAPMTALPFLNQTFDLVLCDAVLMYADPEMIPLALREIQRVARKGVILVEWFSEKEEIKDHHWARNYPALLKDYGFELVEEKPLTPETWPTLKWQTNGRLFVFRVASATSEKSS